MGGSIEGGAWGTHDHELCLGNRSLQPRVLGPENHGICFPNVKWQVHAKYGPNDLLPIALTVDAGHGEHGLSEASKLYRKYHYSTIPESTHM